ncbi:glycoside hydrolase family 3 N-terminal domain-containing protein [Streptomyces sp. ICBB 8177]|uniref:glycoside hydrolase family 3 N-terminal domain-containing protein n=1 Tax=Streptomyces sp. ICBB 8177 TaxID=563922 RepID=UPI001F542B0D|nr:glycoside hydrolase family 3 N-terminal domain-containing protein [Streptomyces sp. ICBB 8177]
MSGRARARNLRLAALPLGVALAVAGCGSSSSPSSHPSGAASVPHTSGTPAPGTTSGAPSGTRSTTAAASTSSGSPSHSAQASACVNDVYAAMSDKQRVGQLFMAPVTATGMTTAEQNAISDNDAGSAILTGRSSAGVQSTKSLTGRIQAAAPTVGGKRVGLLVSADQEGGQVQVLNGPGFSVIPSAMAQGGWPSSKLQTSAGTWGSQLRSAGVDLDLAPVVDVVPPRLQNSNAPIGKLMRNYGSDASTVARQSSAFVRGMEQSGVLTTLKHFPSLGQASGNTDVTAGVTDTATQRTGDYLTTYESGIKAGAQFIMAALAVYQRIDPTQQGAFSPTVLTGMIRDELKFNGVIISDDLGNAAQVRAVPTGDRAVRFIAAGGNLVLTVNPATVTPMTSAVLSRMGSDATFRSQVEQSVKRVLTAKEQAGALSCS